MLAAIQGVFKKLPCNLENNFKQIHVVLLKKLDKKLKIYKIESQYTKVLAFFCLNLYSIQKIHPTRHHAHQPLQKNIKLTGSETKTYN